MKNYKLDTLCVQAGYSPESGEARIPPISQSTTYFYPKTQDFAIIFMPIAFGKRTFLS